MTRTIHYLGYPGPVGGACTEAWHTVRLWREVGWNVVLVPTWGHNPEWEEKLNAIGAETLHVTREQFETMDGIECVVAMCNSNFLDLYANLKQRGIKTVWSNCMTWLFDREKPLYAEHGPPDAFHYQSRFQRLMLEPELQKIDIPKESGHVIHGAFFTDEYPFQPATHYQNGPFVIGKLARADRDKWSSNHWPILKSVPYADRRSLNMGWTDALSKKLGAPPGWAECMVPGSISGQAFLQRCHALIGLNGGARENWPRVGLEAMACGVPLVVQNQWGWREMVVHGETGFLAGNDQEFAYYLAHLAHDRKARTDMIEAARAHLDVLADQNEITEGWNRLFESIGV